MVRDYANIPGLYAAGLYINGMVAEAALGKTDDKEALNRALRGGAHRVRRGALDGDLRRHGDRGVHA